MVKTEELFTFEIDMGQGAERMAKEQLEDVIYNCLDFCLLYRRQPHFYLAGDAVHHPALWGVLEIMRDEGATFSILSGPEQAEYQSLCAQRESAEVPPEKVLIRRSGDACYRGVLLGNALEDRLADMWFVSSNKEGANEQHR